MAIERWFSNFNLKRFLRLFNEKFRLDIPSSIVRDGKNFTVKNIYGNSLFEFDQQDTNTTYSVASESDNGLMSVEDKKKLDGLDQDAQVNVVNGINSSASNAYKVGNVNIDKADVGLGNVKNLDSSVAIKNITRSGTTFTATRVDGTTFTFTQQDNNTTYANASASASGLMTAAMYTKLAAIGSRGGTSPAGSLSGTGTSASPLPYKTTYSQIAAVKLGAGTWIGIVECLFIPPSSSYSGRVGLCVKNSAFSSGEGQNTIAEQVENFVTTRTYVRTVFAIDLTQTADTAYIGAFNAINKASTDLSLRYFFVRVA